ncbi:FkbM family methyltransferase [Vulcanococcus limneticus]|uniref:FkbM family methyltransferase n=1 Tax=Vulcanococcus limneticus TaxID=2170428 RepID=UPI00398BCDD8
MIRSWLAEQVLDYLAFAKVNRGKYRLAQLASLLLDGTVICSVYGPRLHCRFADSTFWLAARYGNEEVMELLADLSPGDGFVDVGANIGLTTCFAASRGAAVMSLEPSAREFADLQRNCQLLAHHSPPVCLSAAACEQSGFQRFRIGHFTHSGGNSLGSARDSCECDVIVQAVRLDESLAEDRLANWPAMLHALSKKSLVVKIDVEGFEVRVLEGMKRLLCEHRCRKVIVEVNPQRAKALDGSLDIDALMAQFGYRPTVQAAGRSHFDQCYTPA